MLLSATATGLSDCQRFLYCKYSWHKCIVCRWQRTQHNSYIMTIFIISIHKMLVLGETKWERRVSVNIFVISLYFSHKVCTMMKPRMYKLISFPCWQLCFRISPSLCVIAQVEIVIRFRQVCLTFLIAIVCVCACVLLLWAQVVY